MHVFISWSGPRSQDVASTLGEWLPDVLPFTKPFVSANDIDKGARWQTEISRALDDSTFGLICITKDRINAPWLLFEAGALSKAVTGGNEPRVAALLLDTHQVLPQPLGQFQSTQATEADVYELCQSINKAASDVERIESDRLRRLFGRAWPDLEAVLKRAAVQSVDEEGISITPPAPDKLDEVLEMQRQLARILPQLINGFARFQVMNEVWYNDRRELGTRLDLDLLRGPVGINAERLSLAARNALKTVGVAVDNIRWSDTRGDLLIYLEGDTTIELESLWPVLQRLRARGPRPPDWKVRFLNSRGLIGILRVDDGSWRTGKELVRLVEPQGEADMP